MLRWLIAAKAPSSIEATAMNWMICRHSVVRPPNGSTRKRMNSAMAAIFGATEKNAGTGDGAPAYRPAGHQWHEPAGHLEAAAARTTTVPPVRTHQTAPPAK